MSGPQIKVTKTVMTTVTERATINAHQIADAIRNYVGLTGGKVTFELDDHSGELFSATIERERSTTEGAA